jgi:metal-sulfur cluster biosynthetic enzyme
LNDVAVIGSAPNPSAIPADELARMTDDIVTALKTVYDPETPVDIYRNVDIEMTLTAPGCPVAGDMPGWVENAVSTVAGVQAAKARIVFDPPWDHSRMSDEARMALNMW